MSDTPRTDEFYADLADSPLNIETACEHLLDFTKTLERELAEATRKPEPLSAPTHPGPWWAKIEGTWQTVSVCKNLRDFTQDDLLFECQKWADQWIPNPAPEVVG